MTSFKATLLNTAAHLKVLSLSPSKPGTWTFFSRSTWAKWVCLLNLPFNWRHSDYRLTVMYVFLHCCRDFIWMELPEVRSHYWWLIANCTPSKKNSVNQSTIQRKQEQRDISVEPVSGQVCGRASMWGHRGEREWEREWEKKGEHTVDVTQGWGWCVGSGGEVVEGWGEVKDTGTHRDLTTSERLGLKIKHYVIGVGV